MEIDISKKSEALPSSEAIPLCWVLNLTLIEPFSIDEQNIFTNTSPILPSAAHNPLKLQPPASSWHFDRSFSLEKPRENSCRTKLREFRGYMELLSPLFSHTAPDNIILLFSTVGFQSTLSTSPLKKKTTTVNSVSPSLLTSSFYDYLLRVKYSLTKKSGLHPLIMNTDALEWSNDIDLQQIANGAQRGAWPQKTWRVPFFFFLLF